MNLTAEVFIGDNRETLKQLPDKSVQTVVTSPPYWGLRDYGEDEQIGLEPKPNDFIENLCLVFDEVWRVLKDDGTIWVNLGDSYAQSGQGGGGSYDKERPGWTKLPRKAPEGLKPKDLVGIPWRFAFAMQDRGWYLRQDIIWAKPNPMPESVTDRCTKSHEYIFLMSKNPKYYYDQEAIQEAGVDAESKRNKRSVWQVTTSRYKDAHFATYPPELITPCILAGSKENDIVLDPFSGSGTTGEVALLQNRNYIGLELSPEYAKLSEKRLLESGGMFASVSLR